MKNLTPLRFPGNKRWLVDYVKDFIIYHKLNDIMAEPYAGSASISLGLLDKGIIKKSYINDKDPMIYAFWYSVFNLNEELIERTKEISTNITVKKYYEFKNHLNKSINSNLNKNNILDYAIEFLFLNRTSYSGIVKGGPIGGKKQESKYKISCRFGLENIIKKIRYLYKFRQQIELSNLEGIDFIQKFANEHSNSLLYIDPPYFKAGKDLYNFYFNIDDHKALADLLLEDEIKNPWLVSYDNDEFIKSLYSKKGIFCDKILSNKCVYVHKKYLISSNKRIAYEILFSNKKIPPYNTLIDIEKKEIKI